MWSANWNEYANVPNMVEAQVETGIEGCHYRRWLSFVDQNWYFIISPDKCFDSRQILDRVAEMRD